MLENATLTKATDPALNALEETFLKQLQEAIATDHLVLPTLPEVAVHVQLAVEDPDISLVDLAHAIGNDTALSARIIKIANSPLAQQGPYVDNLHLAISRLGLNFVRNITTGLAMEQIFQTTNEFVDARMHQAWEHSIEVAAISSVIAKHYTHLPVDQVALGGLVHEIGILPILTFAEDHHEIINNPVIFDRIIDKIHPKIGTAILEAWNFPQGLIEIPQGYVDFKRRSKGTAPDYVDIITVANLYSLRGSNKQASIQDWNSIPAFKKLGIDPTTKLTGIDAVNAEVQKIKQMLW
jgi:HD-like signal output (HDOD) protein